MSGQWEVVGKKKDKNGKIHKQAAIKEAQQQKLMNGVKVEEVLPMSQLKNLYGAKPNKEIKKPPQEKSKKEANIKDKQPAKQAKKPAAEVKVKQFKSIENAFNSIKVDDLSGVYEKNKVVYPTTPIVWLRELAQYLNSHLIVDTPDVTFSSKSEYYPLCAMPATQRAVLEKGLKQAGAENCVLFFDICLTSMANDMNKNLSAIGHKVFIQLLSQQYPKLAVGNIQKYVTLRNSYQNRPNIGMSILWALGQGGLKDLDVGLKVFQEIMYPVVDMKNYTRDVFKYLIAIVKKHSMSSSTLTHEQYMFISDVVYTNKKNMTADLTKELNDVMPVCNDLIQVHGACMEPLLRKLGQTVNKAHRNNLACAFVKCVQKDSGLCDTWANLYAKQLPASASVLSYIEINWRSLSKEIDVKRFKDLLQRFAVINDDLEQTQKNTDGLEECIGHVRRMSSKMAGGKKKARSGGRWLSYVAMLLIGTFVFIDVKQNGGWGNSCTSKALNRTGVYDYTHKAYDCASAGTHWVHNHIEGAFPGITETTVKHTAPYMELGRDVGIIMRNVFNNAKEAAVTRWPIVVDTIETYAPGLIEKTQEVSKNAMATSVVYFENGKDYLMTKVFVGKFAPEEIQKTISASLEFGTEKAQEYYSWIYNKIMTAIK